MYSVSNDGRNGVFALLQHHQEVLLRLSVIHSHCKLIVKLGNTLRMYILEPTVKHQMDQVVNDLAVFPKVKKGL